MIKWAIALVAAIYIVLLVIPDESEAPEVTEASETSDGETTLANFFSDLITQAEDNASRPPPNEAAFSDDDAALREANGSYQLETADGEVLDVVAVINPFDTTITEDSDREIARVTLGNASAQPRPDTPAAEISADAAPDVEPSDDTSAVSALWQVTGDRVNFRAGPSTDDAILTALVRGDQVEYLADAPDDWARLRVVATGVEGFMALEFLEPVTN
ncbi:SH3 domain-containing protein [Gymnodinialimonas sp. 2305UL16-5]|uniref:SH3 domain-containing protein n=1 Tax=Gymnodinialimonas mytili TaxID=3126503 RepID=UPI0030ABFE8E